MNNRCNRSNVIYAILDSYLSMRESTWGKKPNETKVKDCKEIVSKLPEFDGKHEAEEWIKFIYILDETERNQSRLILTPFLQQTLQAIRSFVFTELQRETPQALEAVGTRLVDEQANLRSKISNLKNREPSAIETIKARESELAASEIKSSALDTAAAKHKGKYAHETYFETNIKVYDLRKGLEEPSFDKFCENVLNGKRKTENADKLLAAGTQNTLPKAGSQTTLQSTLFSATIDPKPQTRRRAAATHAYTPGR